MIRRLDLAGAGLGMLGRLAELIALKVRSGDVIALAGDLGAGKTTLARAILRALLGDDEAEVPSPTFPIVQPYVTSRLAVAHFDLYRLSGPDELAETGFEDALRNGLVLVEWPDRADGRLGPDRLEITLAPGATPDERDVTVTGHGTWGPRLERLAAMQAFLAASPAVAPDARLAYLQGDASTRAYARITGPAGSLVLMDFPAMADGPPVRGGLPYSRIAHLAEDVRPFVAVGRALAAAGLSVPHIHGEDLASGFLLLEDLGDLTFGRALAEGHDQRTLWLAAVDTLVALRRAPPPATMPLSGGAAHSLPRFDRAALEVEVELFLDWFWPARFGAPASAVVRAEFRGLWTPVLDRMLAQPPGLFLRDYHSPNLFWLPDRRAPRNVGVIDFQDALAEPWAYDLASLLQDARVDVSPALEQEGLARYLSAVAGREPEFDREALLAAYAAFGAQRNTRLIGLWVRLRDRDGKPHYMQHMARTWDYLARNLRHPLLAPLRTWYEREFPDRMA